MLIYYLFDPNNKYVCVTKTLVNISGSVYKYQTRWNSTVTYITGYKQRNYLLSGNWRHQDICRPPLFKRIDCKLLEALLEAQTEKNLRLRRKTRQSETWVFNRGPLFELFWTDHRLIFQWPQKMPIRPGLSVCISCTALFYRWDCLDPSTDPLVVVYKIPAQDKVALTVCSGTSRLQKYSFISCVLALVKKKKNNKKKNVFELVSPPRSTAFHSNSCWYLLFLWW